MQELTPSVPPENHVISPQNPSPLPPLVINKHRFIYILGRSDKEANFPHRIQRQELLSVTRKNRLMSHSFPFFISFWKKVRKIS